MSRASVPGRIGTVLIDYSEVLTQWDQLLDRVEDGVTFIITRDGQPIVRILPFATEGDGAKVMAAGGERL